MSIETWKAEFYSPPSGLTDLEAIEHSLKKWRGATKENTKKHGVVYEHSAIWKVYDVFSFDSRSCALCQNHLQNECVTCPIVKAGFSQCDEDGAAYTQSRNDPLSMIETLEATLEFCHDN